MRPQQVSSSPGESSATSTPTSCAHDHNARHVPETQSRKFNVDAGNGPASGKRSHHAVENPFVLVVFGLLIAGIGYVLVALGIPRLGAVGRGRVRSDRRIGSPSHGPRRARRSPGPARRSRSRARPTTSTRPESPRVLGPSAEAHGELASMASEAGVVRCRPRRGLSGPGETLSQSIRHEHEPAHERPGSSAHPPRSSSSGPAETADPAPERKDPPNQQPLSSIQADLGHLRPNTVLR